jgi:Putative cyclase
MRLHAGSHIDAPEHNVKGGKQVEDLPLETFAGDAGRRSRRQLVPGKAITAEELERAVGTVKTLAGQDCRPSLPLADFSSSPAENAGVGTPYPRPGGAEAAGLEARTPTEAPGARA